MIGVLDYDISFSFRDDGCYERKNHPSLRNNSDNREYKRNVSEVPYRHQ